MVDPAKINYLKNVTLDALKNSSVVNQNQTDNLQINSL